MDYMASALTKAEYKPLAILAFGERNRLARVPPHNQFTGSKTTPGRRRKFPFSDESSRREILG